jgi:penicillin-binding protein 1A
VWFGNDDYASTNRMTGGSLPAMTWHNIMAYAHQGIELKQLPGIPVPPARQQPVVADLRGRHVEQPPARPAVLTKRGAEALVRVEQMMDEANRALASNPATPNEPKRGAAIDRPDALASTLENASIRGAGRN